MYAIIRTGGKQYKVQPGDVLKIEKLEQDLGAEVVLTDILAVGGESAIVTQPATKDAKVTVVITKQTKDRKVIIFKKKRRQGYRRFKTHRQPYTEIFVKSISAAGKTATTEEQARVVDVDQQRKDRIQARIDAKNERKQPGFNKEEAKAAKKVAKKAAPKAKKAGAKKSTGAKKKTAKKATKK